MKIEFKKSFERDFKKCIKNCEIKARLKELFNATEEISDVKELSDRGFDVKRIKASTKKAYRVRIGNWRIGFYIEGDVIVFMRILRRDEFYNHFP